MPQKINPISNKLGILHIWNHQTQKYGRSFKSYIKSLKPKSYILLYLKRFLLNYNLIIKNVEIICSNHQISVKIFTFNLTDHYSCQNIYTPILSTVSHWSTSPIKLILYQKNSLSDASLLITNYISYLFFQKNNSPKLILQLIYKTLQQQSLKKSLIYTTRGLQLVQLKGFKLEFTGCFESSRSQMSKTIKCNFGSIPLTKLNGYVDYSRDTLFTKFGSCGFKVWLFYELI